MSDSCLFCDEEDALDRHHVVPRRHGGADTEENLVTVCPTCHRKLESLYDKRFYDKITGSTDDTDLPSWWREIAPGGKTIGYWYKWLCNREQEMRKGHGAFDKKAFVVDAQAHPEIGEHEAECAWRRLRDNGLVYDSPVTPGRKGDRQNLSTNRTYLDLFGDKHTDPPEDMVNLRELMRDE